MCGNSFKIELSGKLETPTTKQHRITFSTKLLCWIFKIMDFGFQKTENELLEKRLKNSKFREKKTSIEKRDIWI